MLTAGLVESSTSTEMNYQMTQFDQHNRSFSLQPLNPTASAIEKKQLLLSWTAPVMLYRLPVIGYMLYVNQLDSSGDSVSHEQTFIVGNATQYLVTNLSPSTNYNFDVVAENAIGLSAGSLKSDSYRTLDLTVPSVPLNFAIMVSCSTLVRSVKFHVC